LEAFLQLAYLPVTLGIASILGTTELISEKNSQNFASKISKYANSNRITGNEVYHGLTVGNSNSSERLGDALSEGTWTALHNTTRLDCPACWPLIRQVRVLCNATALATGAILVDLPGIADANAARNSIAKDYIKECNHVYVLAPINRAIDDGTARKLLGEAFKVQLMMDGKCVFRFSHSF
jgi:hypothetical protein